MSDSNEYDAPRVFMREWVKRRFVAVAGAAFVAGRSAAEYIAALGMGRDRVFVGYDAVDNEYFGTRCREVRAECRHWRNLLALPRPYLLAVARFVPKKNLIALLQGYALYRRTAGEDGWDLVVVGGGEQARRLQEEVERLRLNTVHWPGFVQYPDLPEYYALAGGFILASTVEQWGLVVNEAMASSLPVLVSSRAGCSRDLVIHGENGYVFDPMQVDEIALAIGKVASLPEAQREAMGERSRLLIARWGLDRFSKNLWRAARRAAERPRRAVRGVDRALLWAASSRGGMYRGWDLRNREEDEDQGQAGRC